MLLYEDIQHITILIESSPKAMALAVDRHEDFIHMPGIAEVSPSGPYRIGVLLTELQAPSANRRIRDNDTASGEDFFDISATQ